MNRWSHCSCHNVSSVERCDARRYRDAVHFRLDSQQHQRCICSPADQPSFVVWTDLILDVPGKDHAHVGRRSLHVLSESRVSLDADIWCLIENVRTH